MLPRTHNQHQCFKQQLQSSSQPTVSVPEPFFFFFETAMKKKLKVDSGLRVCSAADGGEGGRHLLRLPLREMEMKRGRQTDESAEVTENRYVAQKQTQKQTRGKHDRPKTGKEKRGSVLRAAAALEYCTSDTVPTFYRRASKLTLKNRDLHLWLKAAL